MLTESQIAAFRNILLKEKRNVEKGYGQMNISE